jgi:hypothetical protein
MLSLGRIQHHALEARAVASLAAGVVCVHPCRLQNTFSSRNWFSGSFTDGTTFLFPKGFLVKSRIVYGQLVSKNDEVLQPTNEC